MSHRLFVATKAFVNYNGKILVVRESSKYKDGSNQGKFDVVGGRLEPGQHFQESLLREIQEEAGLKVRVNKPFFVNEWRPVVRGENWHIVGIFFECLAQNSRVKLSGDHNEFRWIDPIQYKRHELIENLSPAFEAYIDLNR